jgi:hypothetical protein
MELADLVELLVMLVIQVLKDLMVIQAPMVLEVQVEQPAE